MSQLTWETDKEFREARFDERRHLGLGDIRITIGQQEEIAARICNLERENAEMREFIGDARPILWYLSLAEYPREENLNLALGAYLWLSKKYPCPERYLESKPPA